MRSLKQDDRTSRAIIRDEALRLFSEHGADAVTLRQIAAAAHVSPALIVRHFGSKDGLRAVVDQSVLQAFEAILSELTRRPAQLPDQAQTGSLVDAMMRHLPPGSPLSRYIGRALLDPTPAGRHLFPSLFEAGYATLTRMVEAGIASPGADTRVRAAFLTANDLAVLLLREPLTRALGFDPLSREGMVRWASEVLAVYSSGLGAPSSSPKGNS